jgi:flagellar motility protein MotE (MotC chaperone)
MKWPPCVTRVRISRVLLWIIFLGTLKVSLLVGLELRSIAARGRSVPEETQAASAVLLPGAALAQSAPSEPEPAPAPQGSLSDEWKRLKEMDRALARREQDLKALEQSIDRKLAMVGEQQAELKRLLDMVDEVRDKKLKHLIDVYSNMKPKQAAEVMETLDEEIAVKILAGMRGRTAGEILSFVNARKAAVLSSRLTHMQIPEER